LLRKGIIVKQLSQKLTPADRKTIYERVTSGEKQVTLASDFDVSEAYISQVMAHERKRRATPTPTQCEFDTDAFERSIASLSADELRLRYKQALAHVRDLLEFRKERFQLAHQERERIAEIKDSREWKEGNASLQAALQTEIEALLLKCEASLDMSDLAARSFQYMCQLTLLSEALHRKKAF